jgi:hypothetical protein
MGFISDEKLQKFEKMYMLFQSGQDEQSRQSCSGDVPSRISYDDRFSSNHIF